MSLKTAFKGKTVLVGWGGVLGPLSVPPWGCDALIRVDLAGVEGANQALSRVGRPPPGPRSSAPGPGEALGSRRRGREGTSCKGSNTPGCRHRYGRRKPFPNPFTSPGI